MLGLWGIGLISALILLVWIFVGPMGSAMNLEGPGLIVPAGGRVSLGTGLLPGWRQEVDLRVRCEPSQDCSVLRVHDHSWKSGRVLHPGDKGDASFRIQINKLKTSNLELINTGRQAVPIKKMDWRNHSAVNTGFPRFAVLLSPFPGPGFSPWITLLLSLGSAIFLIWNLFLLEHRSQGRLNQEFRRAPLLFPWFILFLALVLRFKGMHLLLSWEAFLLTIFPGYLYLGLTSPFFKKGSWCLYRFS